LPRAVHSGRSTGSSSNASPQDLQALFDLGPMPMWVYDVESLRFLAVNDAAILTYGYSRDAFLGMTLDNIHPREDVSKLGDSVRAPSSAHHEFEIWRHCTADGRTLFVEIAANPVTYQDRSARLVVVRDVTMQRRAIDAVEASERRFRDLFQNSVGLICTHDLDGVLLSINPAAATALGYRIADLIGRRMLEIVPPALRSHFDGYLKRIARTGDDAGLLYVMHRDGSPLVWEYHNRVLNDAQGTPFVMGHAQDITQRRLSEHRLREQQAEIEAVSDGSPVGLFRATLDGSFTYINRSYERISGQRTDQAMGAGWSVALHPEDRDRVMQLWATATKARSRFQSTHRFKHSAGSMVWVAVEAAPLIVEGEITGYVGSVEDITARHVAELQLRRNEQRLRTITDALPAMVGYVDASQRFVFANLAYRNAFASNSAPIVGHSMREILGETRYLRRQPYIERALRGERVVFEDEETTHTDYRCIEVTYVPQLDEDDKHVLGLHMMAQDVTGKKLEERRWMQAAEVDSLTGLANRAGFLGRLNRALARSHDQRSMLAVMYLDIDHFKQINDQHGHGVGDAILKAFAERLSAVLRTSDVIARLGGDEFTVITEGVRRPQYAAVAAAKIVAAMRRPFVLVQEQLTLSITTSVGLALSSNEPGITAAALLKRADNALYEAKAAGRDGYRVDSAHCGASSE
jgi:diguanylate cyclase (GGDEF)-like protein/PAS domain S-box-containing protein